MFVEITQQASQGDLGLLYFSTGTSEQRSNCGHTCSHYKIWPEQPGSKKKNPASILLLFRHLFFNGFESTCLLHFIIIFFMVFSTVTPSLAPWKLHHEIEITSDASRRPPGALMRSAAVESKAASGSRRLRSVWPLRLIMLHILCAAPCT